MTSLILATLVWIVGLLTLVPYASYYLWFHAPREQYALLITTILFWVFGYWGVVGPLLAALKARAVWRSIEQAGSRDELQRILSGSEAESAAVDFLAAEHHIPRFLAARVFRWIRQRAGVRHVVDS